MVKEEKLDRAKIPADGSSIKYTLVELLEKKQTSALPFTTSGRWKP